MRTSQRLNHWRGAGWTAIALTVGLIGLADWLFYKQPVGWTLGLYLAAVVAVLLIRSGRTGHRTVTFVLTVLLLGLAAAMVLEPGPLSVAMATLGVIMLATVRRIGWNPSTRHWIHRLVRFPVHSFAQPLRDITLYQRWFTRARATSRGRSSGCLVTWFLPVALSAVFVGLFCLANPVLSLWSQQLGEWFGTQIQRWAEWVHPARMLLWVAIGAIVWGLLRMRTRRGYLASWRSRIVVQPGPWVAQWNLTPTVVRCLILFNVVFAGQLLLDARYLLAGAALPQGMTYAQYAHRGAYPLMATSLLAGAFALVTFRSRGPAERSRLARVLVYLWLGQNLALLASAAWRLRMYVDVYSLTMWRIAAAIWMLLVALGLAWIVLRIVYRRSNVWLLRVNILTAATVLYICCFLNFAGWIAWFNVTRCADVGGPGVPIDLVYLERLGSPALPATRWLQQHTIRSARHDTNNVAAAAGDVAQRLEYRLNEQLAHWRSWTLLRQRVAATAQ